MASHPWASEANRLIPASVRRVARDGVRIQRADGTLIASLATNPGLQRWEVSQADGVEREAPEVERAEKAIIARVLSELVAHDTMRAWIGRAARAAGGNGPLVDALMGAKRMPPGYRIKKRGGGQYSVKEGRANYRANLMRAIQRSGPGKKPGREQEHPTGNISREHQARIDRYRGGPQAAAGAIIDEAQVKLGVKGDWYYQEEPIYEFERLNVPREWEPAGGGRVHEVYLKRGEGLVDTVHDGHFEHEAIQLRKVYALYAEVIP